MNKYQSVIEELMIPAGIELGNGENSDLIIHDERFYDRILRDGSLGLGESYMDGWWDSSNLDGFLYKLLCANIEKQASRNWQLILHSVKSKLLNLQTIAKSGIIAKKHYDLGNDLFEKMLDKYMQYSCAYWTKAKTLDKAQQHKLELICRKLKLEPGQNVLDIGCGWGGFAQYAAEKYQVKVTGITISKNQALLARKRCKGLPVEISLQDYRALEGSFDRIVSVGMFEHVGYKNYAEFMSIAQRCLKRDGIFLLHCIGGNESTTKTDVWINRYIFPNGMMPSVKQVGEAIEGRFILQDWHNFGLHYDRTIMAWLKNFKNSKAKLGSKYEERFYRMWEYYLCLSAVSFRAKRNHLWQIVLTHQDFKGEYQAVR